jgi:hypothetical protein
MKKYNEPPFVPMEVKLAVEKKMKAKKRCKQCGNPPGMHKLDCTIGFEEYRKQVEARGRE